jgi:hypothetical protein
VICRRERAELFSIFAFDLDAHGGCRRLSPVPYGLKLAFSSRSHHHDIWTYLQRMERSYLYRVNWHTTRTLTELQVDQQSGLAAKIRCRLNQSDGVYTQNSAANEAA